MLKKKKRLTLSIINKKLDKLLGLEKKELIEEERISKLELLQLDELKQGEERISKIEKQGNSVIDEIEKLEDAEKKIREKIGTHPLKKISYRDAGKSMVGAFVGMLSHFAVLEGVKLSEEITLSRASFLYFVSLLIAILVLYYTGFRKIKDKKLLSLLPLRVILIYVVTIITILIVLLIIGKLENVHFLDVYKAVSVLTMPGIIGACVADLIGGD